MVSILADRRCSEAAQGEGEGEGLRTPDPASAGVPEESQFGVPVQATHWTLGLC